MSDLLHKAKPVVCLTSNNLTRDNTIQICRLDKENEVAILNKIDYFNELDLIIVDATSSIKIPITDFYTHPITRKKILLGVMSENI